jgi:hypothetical protein
MAFRFHRSINLIPGLKLNLGKKGISASIGARGAWFTVGAKGTRTTLGVPGTGLSYSAYTPYKKQKHQSHQNLPVATTSEAITPPISTTVCGPDVGLSSGFKTAIMALVAFLVAFAVLSPAKQPKPAEAYYTGCELSGAIKDCGNVMQEYLAADNPTWGNGRGLPLIAGSPTRENQITAVGVQFEAQRYHQSVINNARYNAEYEAEKRERYRKLGVRD